MRFAFIAKNEGLLPINRLRQIMDVSPRGYRAWRTRPMSETQRADIVVLAHIREQFALSLGSYGRPRMAEELRELGLAVGERKVGRLMRENALAVKRNKKFKGKVDQFPDGTDSNHSFNIAPTLLDRDFFAEQPNQKWGEPMERQWSERHWRTTSAMSGPGRAGCISQ